MIYTKVIYKLLVNSELVLLKQWSKVLYIDVNFEFERVDEKLYYT